MNAFMTTDEVLKDLKISESTLKNWEKQFRIKKNRGPGNKKRYNEEAMETLRMVKSLRNKDRGFDTIQRVLKEKEESTQQVTPVENKSPVLAEAHSLTTLDKQDIMSGVVQVIQDQNELSEKYARATYSIGQLEAEKQALKDKLELDRTVLEERYGLEKQALENQLTLENKSLKEKVELENKALKQQLETEKQALQEQLNTEKKYLKQQITELQTKIETQDTLLNRLKKHWFIRLFWVD